MQQMGISDKESVEILDQHIHKCVHDLTFFESVTRLFLKDETAVRELPVGVARAKFFQNVAQKS